MIYIIVIVIVVTLLITTNLFEIGGSSDSRSYGFIPQSDITGYVIFAIYPDSESWGFIK